MGGREGEVKEKNERGRRTEKDRGTDSQRLGKPAASRSHGTNGGGSSDRIRLQEQLHLQIHGDERHRFDKAHLASELSVLRDSAKKV